MTHGLKRCISVNNLANEYVYNVGGFIEDKIALNNEL